MSSLGLMGSNNCPDNKVYQSWPPPPPPLPKPCTDGPDPRRGCPNFEWYWGNRTVRINWITLYRYVSPICGAWPITDHSHYASIILEL